jgi:hypothetical protein
LYIGTEKPQWGIIRMAGPEKEEREKEPLSFVFL